jgi:EpsI family protein
VSDDSTAGTPGDAGSVALEAEGSRMRAGTVKLLLWGAFAVVLAAYLPTILSFFRVWGRYNYSHGYIIAPLVAWLVWRKRQKLATDVQDLRVAYLGLILLSVIWLLAMIMEMQVVHQGLLPIVLLLWVAAVFGANTGRVLIPIVGVFFLAVPFWELLIVPLQMITVTVSGFIVKLAGISADIRGEVILLPSGSIHVADTCAGLRFFLVGLVLGAIYGQIFLKNWRSQVLVFGLAGLISMIANWIRVTSLVFIGHFTQMESGLLSSHVTFGWVIFTLSLVPLFVLARQVEKWDESLMRDRTPRREADSDPVDGREMDVDYRELNGSTSDPTPSPFRDPALLRRGVLATGLAIVGPVIFLGMTSLPRAEVPDPGLSVLIQGDGWEAAPEAVERPFTWAPAFQGASQHQQTSFTNGEARVFVDRLIYRDQTQGAELIFYANRIAEPDAVLGERLLSPMHPEGRWVNEALVRTPEGPVLVWYWYEVGGVETAFEPWAKTLEILAFVRRSPRAELFAVSALCSEDGCEEAFQALRSALVPEGPEAGG